MKKISDFLKIIYAIYGGIYFMITMILVFPCYYLLFAFKGKKTQRKAHLLTKIWSYITFVGLFIRVKVKNKELIDLNKTYVMISNHQSLLDLPAYALTSDITCRFLAKEELTKVPVIGYVIKNLYLWVKREDRGDRKRSMQTMMDSLHDGVSVFLCPEGTRNKSNELLLGFKDGAFSLAIESQCPLAVLTLCNTKPLLPPTGFFRLSPGTIHAMWNQPIETKGMTEKDLPALKEKARNIILENLQRFEKNKTL